MATLNELKEIIIGSELLTRCVKEFIKKCPDLKIMCDINNAPLNRKLLSCRDSMWLITDDGDFVPREGEERVGSFIKACLKFFPDPAAIQCCDPIILKKQLSMLATALKRKRFSYYEVGEFIISCLIVYPYNLTTIYYLQNSCWTNAIDDLKSLFREEGFNQDVIKECFITCPDLLSLYWLDKNRARVCLRKLMQENHNLFLGTVFYDRNWRPRPLTGEKRLAMVKKVRDSDGRPLRIIE